MMMMMMNVPSRGSGRVLALLTIVMSVLLQATATAQIQQCAGFGEYCQNHWDCCSNTCMSYLYRCTRNYDAFGFYADYRPAPPVAPSTLEDIVALNFGGNGIVGQDPKGIYQRFDGVEDLNELHFRTAEKPAAVAGEGATIRTEPKIVNENVNTINSPSPSPSPSPSLSPLPTRVPLTPTEEPSFDTAKTTTTTATPTTITITSGADFPATRCSRIGSKCYRNEECCTVRCHGYLHQCVT